MDSGKLKQGEKIKAYLYAKYSSSKTPCSDSQGSFTRISINPSPLIKRIIHLSPIIIKPKFYTTAIVFRSRPIPDHVKIPTSMRSCDQVLVVPKRLIPLPDIWCDISMTHDRLSNLVQTMLLVCFPEKMLVRLALLML